MKYNIYEGKKLKKEIEKSVYFIETKSRFFQSSTAEIQYLVFSFKYLNNSRSNGKDIKRILSNAPVNPQASILRVNTEMMKKSDNKNIVLEKSMFS